MQLYLIWAQARGRAIGRNNTLPWRLPEDLRHFKAATLDRPVIMGRKTFDSLPGGALPGRDNIVVTRDPASVTAAGVQVVTSLEDALALAAGAERVFVIGGAELYRLALPLADRLLVTEVDIDVDGADAFAPVVPLSFLTYKVDDWQTSRTQLRYRVIEYRRAT
jgi:dihydrofolate reductase